MTEQFDSRIRIAFRRVSRAAGAFVLAVGTLVLLGWFLGFPILKNILPDLALMKANAAAGFILLGCAILLKRDGKSSRMNHLLAHTFTAVVILLGTFTLVEYIFDGNFGIDQLLFKDPQTLRPFFPGRMSITTALDFTLLGMAMLLIEMEQPELHRPGQLLALVAGTIAFIALIGYLYGVESLYSMDIYSSMALLSALNFFLLALGVLCSHPQRGLMDIVSTETIGGVVLRRFLPSVIIIPVGIGWLRLWGQQAGYYDTYFGLALMVTLSAFTLSVVIWLNAGLLNRVDTSRKQTEGMFEESQLQRAGIINSAMDAIVSIDESQRILIFNPAAEKMFQRFADKVIGKPLTMLIPERLRAAHVLDVRAFGQTAVAKHSMGRLKTIYGLRANGEEFPLEVSISQVEIGGKKIFTAILRDITDREWTKSALQESEARKGAILELALDCIITIDGQGRILEFNPAAEATFGYARAYVMGKNMAELIIPPFLREQHRRGFEKYLATGKSSILGRRIEMTAMRADGSEFPVELTIARVTIDNPPIFTGFLRDISERKQAEEALQKVHSELELRVQERTLELAQANELLRTLMDSTPDNIFFKDTQGRFLKVSRSQAKWFGLDEPAEMLGKTDFDFFADEHVHQALADEQAVMRTGQPVVGFEEHEVWPDGRETWVLTTKVPLRDNDGRIVGTFGIARNITERKRAEVALQQAKDELEIRVAERTAELNQTNEQLRLELRARKQAEDELRFSEERYRMVIEQASDGIFISDNQGNYIDANPRGCDMLGYDRAEIIKLNIREVVAPQELVSAPLRLDELKEGKTVLSERKLRRKDGSTFFGEISARMLPNGNMQAIVRDMTERKRSEDALRENESNARALLRLSKRLEQTQTYADALNAALDEVKAVLGYQNVWAYLMTEDKQQLRLLTTTGEISQVITDDFPTLTIKGDRFLEEIAEGKDMVLVEDARSDPRTNKEIVAQLGNRTIVNVPIVMMEKHLGAFGTGSFGDEGVRVPTPIQLEYLQALASHMAVTFDRIHLLAERRQAEDELRKLNEGLEQRVSERTHRLEHTNRELENSKREFQSVLDSMSTLNAKVALDGTLLFINKIATQAAGLPIDELMKTNFLEGQWWTFDPQVHVRVKDAFARACSGMIVNYDEKIFAFGQVLAISFSLTPMFGSDDHVEYILAEGRDISKLKEYEKSLQARTAQLETSNRELEAFSYSVSHDLRAPLRAIDGFSRILIEDYASTLDKEGQRYLGIVRDNTQQMGHLIDDLLAFSRLNRQGIQMQHVSPTKLVRQSFIDLQAEQKGRQVKITIGDLPPCQGDSALLKQVFLNLISNALKFTRKREIAQIEFGGKLVEGEMVYFVKDNGAGFDMQYADKLFGVFQRLHRAEEFEGTGVGLAIVQRVIHRHGGRVWAEGKIDQGATFFLTLPGVDGSLPKHPRNEKETIASRAKDLI